MHSHTVVFIIKYAHLEGKSNLYLALFCCKQGFTAFWFIAAISNHKEVFLLPL